jgi:hypothetical protein
MVIAARRAYSDATRWIRSSRPRRLHGWNRAGILFVNSFLAGVLLLGVIGILAPSRFGSPGATAFRSGLPSFALIGIVALCGMFAFIRRKEIVGGVRQLREPAQRAFREDPAFEGAVNALEACPGPMQSRFALFWVWGPAALFVLGGVFAFSAAYFVIDAVLASFSLGWEQAALGAGNSLASVAVFRLAAARLATWRLALSVYRSATEGYPA